MALNTDIRGINIVVKSSLWVGLGFLGFATLLIMWHLQPAWKQVPIATQALASGVGGGLALLGLVAHELAHVSASQKLELGIQQLRFSGLIGGAHVRTRRPHTPGHLFILTVVGPLTNLVLAGLLVGVGTLIGRTEAASWSIFWVAAAHIQFLFAGLQLLPMLPGDGGKIMEAGLWALLGNRQWAIKIVGIVGSLLAGLIMWGWGWWAKGAAFYPDATLGVILGVIVTGVGLWQGHQYYHLHQGLDRLWNHTVREATEFFPVSLNRQEASDWASRLNRPVWITAQGQRLGVIGDQKGRNNPHHSLQELMCPMEETLTVSSQHNLGELLERVGRKPDQAIVVQDPHLGEGLLSFQQVFQQAGWNHPN